MQPAEDSGTAEQYELGQGSATIKEEQFLYYSLREKHDSRIHYVFKLIPETDFKLTSSVLL
jgi:hypothetical protein